MADPAYVSLALVPGIGAHRVKALVNRFGSAAGVFGAPAEVLSRVRGMNRIAAAAVAGADREAGGRVLEAAARLGARVLAPADSEYSAMLQTIPDPPPLLFAQGRLELLERPAVAIVGSRDHSLYGAEVCRALAGAAALRGLIVVSGMARGLDAVAHLGALDAGGGTIGVLGNGLGVTYPAENRDLYGRVAGQGLLLTELPPGEAPNAGSFSRRNRLISGLARVTVVIEAASSSGTLGTVGFAQDQGREVLAVPGPITSPVSAGTNGLIRDGATPLLEIDDLMRHYPEAASARRSAEPADHPPLAVRLLLELSRQPLSAEALIDRSGAPVEEALEALSRLELGGRVRQDAGWYRSVATGLFG